MTIDQPTQQQDPIRATLIDSAGGYTQVTSVNGCIEFGPTQDGTGAVASIMIPDTVRGRTRTLKSVNGLLIVS